MLVYNTWEDAGDNYGFTLKNGSELWVNIQVIWEEAEDIESFINTFADVYLHEEIHSTIRRTCNGKELLEVYAHPRGEETAVRLMLEQEFDDTAKAKYKKKRKIN